MAHMDMHYGFSVNGVAALHTEILKKSELKPFYDIYPGKFNNKTNGITFRRWLLHCNPELAAYITELIGDGWKKNAAELEKLLEFQNDEKVLSRFIEIKAGKKPKTPVTMIFGAKAAPAYILAKDIIHLILCLRYF